MYLSEIFASGFRCFGPSNPLSLVLRPGLNVLVGPNDAGKTAVVDVPRFVLWTRGDEFHRLEVSDFHVQPDGRRVNEILLRCTFGALTPDEEGRFLEWCSNEDGTLRLHVCLRAAIRRLSGGGTSAVPYYRSGKAADGLPVEGELRDYLRATYLRPLRDAERELRSGRRSRLSRILGALPLMAPQANPAEPGTSPTLKDAMIQADQDVEGNQAVQSIQSQVNNTYLRELSFDGDPLLATLGLGSRGSFDQLLERLELYLNSPHGQPEKLPRGLGYNNLLFMAAELLLLQSHPDQIPLLLIEEPEAHLHPQHQTLFMKTLEQRAAGIPGAEMPQQPVQVILSTHSPQLAASADLDSMLMIVAQRAYPLAKGQTQLEPDDYAFLRRFIDATKANLFFARGLVIVEGDSENILLPAIAHKIGKPFGRYGVSIVNVGHRGLFRYSRILQRADGIPMPIPVALVPDRDIPPAAARLLVGDRKTEDDYSEEARTAHLAALSKHAGGCVKVFPSEQWTLEFDLARNRTCAALVHQAVQLARELRGKTREEIKTEASAEVERWQSAGRTGDEIAVDIFTPVFRRSVSKTEVAEQLAALVYDLPDSPSEFRMKVPRYLISAIDHVAPETAAGQSVDSSPMAAAAAAE